MKTYRHILILKVNVQDILEQTVRGKLVLEYFNQYKNLTPAHQQTVSNCLIDSLTSKQDTLSTGALKKISEKIAETFVGENTVNFTKKNYLKLNFVLIYRKHITYRGQKPTNILLENYMTGISTIGKD